MGTVYHRAMMVTGPEESIKLALAKAQNIGLLVSEPTKDDECFGAVSFAVFPCGSKEQYFDCEQHRDNLHQFKVWLWSEQRSLTWVAVQYDYDHAIVVDSSSECPASIHQYKL